MISTILYNESLRLRGAAAAAAGAPEAEAVAEAGACDDEAATDGLLAAGAPATALLEFAGDTARLLLGVGEATFFASESDLLGVLRDGERAERGGMNGVQTAP